MQTYSMLRQNLRQPCAARMLSICWQWWSWTLTKGVQNEQAELLELYDINVYNFLIIFTVLFLCVSLFAC